MRTSNTAFSEFISRFQLFTSKNPDLLINTLSNIFSMRKIGNKTHGDLAEVGISEFINQFMYDYRSKHVGKDLFRQKKHEEDIQVESLVGSNQGKIIPISLKAYGIGPLQLSTDKSADLFQFLSNLHFSVIKDRDKIDRIFNSEVFSTVTSVNVFPLIYDEVNSRCNILIFDYAKACQNTYAVYFVDKDQVFDQQSMSVIKKKGRRHPIFLFVGSNGQYLFEVRYGGASANALQRGVWTNTKIAECYFISLTNGWIDYSMNDDVVRLFSKALVARSESHKKAEIIIQKDIDLQKEHS